ncbi:MAG: HlyD family secretion protein [Scytolyngbya sp. HA4215-MV1]|nr:HlyD family secretion protein [Scytolyngbya sp. HA4215-MV1]
MKIGLHSVSLFASLILVQTGGACSYAIPLPSSHPAAPHTATASSTDLAIRLEIARKSYESYQELYQAGAISRQELDQAEQNYQMIVQMTRSSAPSIFSQPLSVKVARHNQRTALQAQLTAAEATVQFTHQDYQRYQVLYQEGAISREQFEHREKVYREALATRDTLQKQLQQRP